MIKYIWLVITYHIEINSMHNPYICVFYDVMEATNFLLKQRKDQDVTRVQLMTIVPDKTLEPHMGMIYNEPTKITLRRVILSQKKHTTKNT